MSWIRERHMECDLYVLHSATSDFVGFGQIDLSQIDTIQIMDPICSEFPWWVIKNSLFFLCRKHCVSLGKHIDNI